MLRFRLSPVCVDGDAIQKIRKTERPITVSEPWVLSAVPRRDCFLWWQNSTGLDEVTLLTVVTVEWSTVSERAAEYPVSGTEKGRLPGKSFSRSVPGEGHNHPWVLCKRDDDRSGLTRTR